MRIAVLYSRLSGYMATCLHALKKQGDVELMIVRIPPTAAAPFEADVFASLGTLHDRGTLDRATLRRVVDDFDPHALYMSGWFDRDYLAVARGVRRRGVPVVAGSDAQWEGSWRQQLGRLAAPWLLHRAIDVLWVAGERQRQLAYRLGFRGRRVWEGVYACDHDRFAAPEGGAHHEDVPHFLFVGRYAPVKGIDTLLEAYARYRAEVAQPWGLVCLGAGELAPLFRGREGVTDGGFVQPDALPERMHRASAFVLPSRREPWGVVVQEAAAAGLPLICSDACGAAVHLLRDGYNGFLVARDDPQHLAEAMVRTSRLAPTERRAMGRRSTSLSRQYTPRQWAATLLEGIERINGQA